MSLKKTLLFFLIFAFIGTYYYLIEIKKAEKIKKIEREEKRVFSPVKKEEISEVIVEKENKKTIRLVRESNTWKIKEPVEADGDEESLKIWLDYVEKLPKERVVTESSENISEFGLDKPSFTVHVKAADGSAMTLVSGDEIPTGSMFYSKLKRKDTIFLIAAYNKNGIDKSAYELRDKKIFHFEKEDIQGFKIDTAAGNYSVEKKDGTWQVVEPKQVPADIEKITSLLQKTRTTDIKKFIAEEADDLTSYGLKDPHTKITFLIGKDKAPHILALGKENAENEGIYAKTVSKNKVFLLKKEFLKGFPYLVNDIRDKSIIRFNEDKIARIKIKAEGKEYLISKTKDEWTLDKPEKKKLETITAKEILWGLGDIKFTNIIDESGEVDLAAFGLQKPAIKVNLLDDKENNLESLFIGTKIKDEDLLFAMTGKSKTIYSIKQRLNDELLSSIKSLVSIEPQSDTKER